MNKIWEDVPLCVRTNSKMFPFIHGTVNPVGVKCPYNCLYCWARRLIDRAHFTKYQTSTATLDTPLLNKPYVAGQFIFVEDLSDLCNPLVPDDMLQKVITFLPKKHPDTRFLFSTKNPRRYFKFSWPPNAMLGATIESNRNYPQYSNAPRQIERLFAMYDAYEAWSGGLKTFISVEPILDFDLDVFAYWLERIRPWGVAVGYDNYGNKLVEPRLAKTEELIKALEKAGIHVFKKTLRKAWNE